MDDLAYLAVLLVLSGVFSGSETALTTLSIARAEGLRKEGRRGAQAVYELKLDPSRMLITILIGNNVVNIAASAMATVVATRWLGAIGPGIAVGVLTVLVLIFGEITPKSLATRYSERISLFMGPLILGLMRLMYPAVWLFQRLTNWIQSKTGGTRDPLVTESELITMIEYGEEEGAIEAGEADMIERVFKFGDLRVEDVMTPRGDVFALDGRRSIADALPQIAAESYTRIPLFEDDPTEVVAVIYVRDVLEALADGSEDKPLSSIARNPLVVPRNQPVDDLVALLRRKKQHLAVVVDEHGSMQGVVTLEDLLEELVGEIYDESDEMRQEYTELPEGDGILVDGSAELRVVETYFGTELPGKSTDSVSRWLLHHIERIPEAEEKFSFDGFEVVVHSASSHRIHQVALKRLSDAENTPARE